MYIPLDRMNILWYTITTITKETIVLLERVPEEDQFVMPTTECGKMKTNKLERCKIMTEVYHGFEADFKEKENAV